ncbi:MAG TPA: hypothetical protein VMB47_06050 [Candidatus Aquilonibacter sp.]|nr:hypothetical protein [Candidatus Aquilonibacter sp.]
MAEEPEKNVEDSKEKGPLSAIILTVLIIIVAIYSTSYGLQTLQWISAHRWASQNPWLYDVPQPVLAATAPNAALSPENTAPDPRPKEKKESAGEKTTDLTEYGYQMTVPWGGTMKESPSAGGAQFKFDSGQVVVFGDPDAQLDTLHILRDTQGPEYAAYQPLFANGSIATNYDLYDAVYSASPSQVSPFSNYAKAQRDRILLLLKLSFGFDLAKPIYSFDLGANKGFQFGDPTQGPVALRVFDNHEKQFRFIFTVFTGSGAQITQADLNQAIQSLRSVLAPAAK